jgi:hypothetical protein
MYFRICYSIIQRTNTNGSATKFRKLEAHFVDIHKQWYLGGLMLLFRQSYKVLDFLKIKTAGYGTITGSSAGGYGAGFGGLLGSERICSTQY